MRAIFNNFEGVWRLSRQISGMGNVLGKATFKRIDSQALHYREEGVFRNFQGVENSVYREYIYRLNNKSIQIFFKENPEKLFVTLNLNGGVAQDTHLCHLDKYEAVFRYIHQNAFELNYTVSGPKKNYQMITLYEKEEV